MNICNHNDVAMYVTTVYIKIFIVKMYVLIIYYIVFNLHNFNYSLYVCILMLNA